ncbi:N-methyl-L-tryptophan oxidase [Amycolatopsis roodepoortensis]|uniref:N-methyl-L-tryptophan oxidase n=1 Tax=Amycolatopsis roodepoortensis TaxID=700274 RepID=UPI00214BB914|nr:N-methyl-L-tryptophan oxidase [Amycolatopsis roodepoortensis]UUV31218.1 N-methyl-L-tryptophan oxidase [Amycolatopsis roodepoortensis]
MPEPDTDVVVVGLGAWGSMALWQLASRGVRAVGVERHGRGHSLGASHGGSRMFRITCLEHPGLVPLARRSAELWEKLGRQAGRPLLHRYGGLLIGAPDSAVAGGTLAAAKEHGIEVERLGRAQLAARFPQHTALAADDIGVWEPSAGLLRPEESIRAALDAAETAGAQVFTGTEVTGFHPTGDRVLVHSAARTWRARRVVVATGSWLPFMTPLPELRVVRMPVTWFRPDGGADHFRLAEFPVFMRELDGGTVLWGCGADPPYDVKLGLEQFGATAVPFDPLDTDRSVTPADWTALRDVLAGHLPGLRPEPSRVAVCMLTLTPDGQFVLGSLPEAPDVIVAGGDNAHGFKHATGIGELLADLATGHEPRLDFSFMDVKRFR